MCQILDQRPYLAGNKKIPDAPHLILAPGTLISQWWDELRLLFLPKGVDLLVYPSLKEEREYFWSPGGTYDSAKHQPASRIILAAHSVGVSSPIVILYLINPVFIDVNEGI